MTENLILLSDSYKITHWNQYPTGTEHVYSYLESRGGLWDSTVFFGLQYIVKKYLMHPITQENIEEAAAFSKDHFGNEKLFNREGWEYILKAHNGYLPVRIRAVPEGSVVSVKNVLMTIENTDPKVPWLTNYLETLLLQVWYPTTVATLSREYKKLISNSLEKTGDIAGLPFKLHDFGFRGVSSVESAALGGAAHLVNFMGSDTVEGIMMLRNYYKAPMAGFSIPATEHSTITSWGQANEVEAFRNLLEQNPTGLVACVSDSYDIIHACKELWGRELKDLVLSRQGTLVVRPDSGEPDLMVIAVLKALGEAFGYAYNEKKYKVLPPQVRVIYGDGIDLEMLPKILYSLRQDGWSTDNVAFGCGGALLQKVNRDTQKFAIKCSNIQVNGQNREVFKNPVSDPGKASKKGKLKLVLTPGKQWLTVPADHSAPDELCTVYENGKLYVDETLDIIRERAKL